jgi:hypothetical protein
VLWIALVAGLVAWGLLARRGTSSVTRAGWLAALAALVTIVLATRVGARALIALIPTLAWLASRWLQSAVPGEQPRPASGPAHARDPMTQEDALRVLGLRAGASKAEIATAHRNLIKKVHPDHGGSDLLAQQVNEAKRVLDSSAPP